MPGPPGPPHVPDYFDTSYRCPSSPAPLAPSSLGEPGEDPVRRVAALGGRTNLATRWGVNHWSFWINLVIVSKVVM